MVPVSDHVPSCQTCLIDTHGCGSFAFLWNLDGERVCHFGLAVCLSVCFFVCFCSTVEPRFNEPLFNEVLDMTNDILCPGQSYSKMYGIEPRYNEFFDITNIIRKPKRKIYLDITNYNVNTQQKINADQINTLKVSFFGKQSCASAQKWK